MPDYPTLRDWLRNAKSGSPWLPFFHGTAQDPGICGALETILGRLEATNPSGLGSLKKRFGDDDEGNVFGLRTELLIGFQLAEAGIPFRFGGRAEPDVKCEFTPEIWIEARTRSRDVPTRGFGGRAERDHSSCSVMPLTLAPSTSTRCASSAARRRSVCREA